ncbi:MAG: M16 family metallopeptidase [Vulcanimicrobiaceae bacterium]
MKRYLGILILAAALVAANGWAQASPRASFSSDVYSTHLANGLQVVVIQDRSTPVVETQMWYRFGSLDETPGKTGLAHGLEHMMFRGTHNVSAGGLDDIVARLGAQMNGSTSYDYTNFYFMMPADKLNIALYLEADRMQNLALRARDWAVEHKAVLDEIEGDQSSPFFNLLARVRAAAFPNQPNGRTPLGHKADVEHATVADLRRYYDEWYAPNNATLVVAGDVNHQTVFADAAHFFGAIPARKTPHHYDANPKASAGAVVEAQFPYPFDIVDLAYAVPGDTQPGEPAIATLATLIQNERSPFYRALVQSNIALSVQTNEDTQLKGGLLDVFLVLNPGHTSAQAQCVFQATMNRVLRTGYAPSLVRAAKRVTLAQRLFAEDSIDGYATLAGYTYGVVGERMRDEQNRIRALTSSDLLAATRAYLATPTVVGHLRPTDTPPKQSSNADTTTASDNFSKRVPNGPIIMPSWIRTAIDTPTTVSSTLHPVSFTLPNGLRVIVERKTDHPTFVVSGTIGWSPAFEPKGLTGIESLANSVADYGSQHYPFAKRRQAIDDLGAEVADGQSFGARGVVSDFVPILRIMADGLVYPSFAQPWFGIERAQLANSLNAQSRISGVVMKRAYLHLLLAPGDPALRQATPASVRRITHADLLAYTKRYWRPDLTTLVVVGDLSVAQVRSAMYAAFGSWQNHGPKPNTRLPALPPAAPGHAWVGTSANQVSVQLGQPAIGRENPDYEALRVLNQILGASGNFESRLWQGLRQKRGLVYSVGSQLAASRHRGDFSVDFSASPNHVVAAVALIRKEIRRLQREPVTANELADAKSRITGSALLQEASSGGQAGQLLGLAIEGEPLNSMRTLRARLAAVTAADVQRVAKKYLHPSRMIQIYGGPPGLWSNTSL